MKFIIAVVGFLAVNLSSCYVSAQLSDPDTFNSAKYLQYLKQRSQLQRLRSGFERLCPGKDEELDIAMVKFKTCSDEIDENAETACSAIKNHFKRCTNPLTELLEECLPEEAKEVPRLVFDGVLAGATYLCKTDGEHIFELANSCIYKSSFRSMTCQRRLKSKFQRYQNQSPTKTEICEMAQSFKPCLHNHLQDSCGNSITRESFMGIFDALLTPCKTTSDKVDFQATNEVELLE